MLEQTNLAGEVQDFSPDLGQQARDRGPLVRLATSPEEVDAAQALRYRVFFGEMNGRPSVAAKWRQRDFDIFDGVADHFLVLDSNHGSGAAGVVAAIRLSRGRAARSLSHYLPAPGFSVAADFNIETLLSWSGEIVEISRACVHPDSRSHSTVGRLWQGIATYLYAYNIGLMFGTVGLPGSQPIEHLSQLAYLHHTRLAPPELRPQALSGWFVNMDHMPAAAVDHDTVWKAMPPALKGYLRLGAVIGHGAVVNSELDTLDVCMVVRVDGMPDGYRRRYLGRL